MNYILLQIENNYSTSLTLVNIFFTIEYKIFFYFINEFVRYSFCTTHIYIFVICYYVLKHK